MAIEDDNEQEFDNEQEDIGSWLTAEEVAAECGVDPSAVTRAYQSGRLKGERRKERRGAKSVFVYQPDAVKEARLSGQLGSAQATEGILTGAALNQREISNLAVRLADKLIEATNTVVQAQIASTTLVQELARSFLDQFKRVDDRCAHLERTQLEYVKAREELLSQEAERDLEFAKFERSSTLREKALTTLAENAPALLELASILTKKDTKEESCPYPSSPSSQPPEPPGSCSEAGPPESRPLSKGPVDITGLSPTSEVAAPKA